jgi:hypothetical protein
MIYQGTTPTVTIAIKTSQLLVADIISLSLAFSGRTTIVKGLDDVVIDPVGNTISYTLTEAETMALNAFDVIYQLRAEDKTGTVWATSRFATNGRAAVDKGLISV